MTILLINTLWDSWKHMILVYPTTVHHLKTYHVENTHSFYPELSPQSFWSSWAASAEIKGFIPTSLCTKQMYWLNNLRTAVHKASGLETARLGFTWVSNICGWTRLHFFSQIHINLIVPKIGNSEVAQFPDSNLLKQWVIHTIVCDFCMCLILWKINHVCITQFLYE